VVIGLFGIDALCLFLARGRNVVWTEVERSDHVEGNLAVKPEALEPNRGNFLAALVEGTNLSSAKRKGRQYLGLIDGERNRRGRTDRLWRRRGHVEMIMGVGEEKGGSCSCAPLLSVAFLKRVLGPRMLSGQPESREDTPLRVELFVQPIRFDFGKISFSCPAH
jgi:hypothetical protein